jgi:hypothetical protein
MAITNQERVGKAIDHLREGLRPFIEREMKATFGEQWMKTAEQGFPKTKFKGGMSLTDPANLLSILLNEWNRVFEKTLGKTEKNAVHTLKDVRNKWAHGEPFSSDEAYRAIDTAGLLLNAISAPQVDEIEKMKMELLRTRFEDQRRSEVRRTAVAPVEGIGQNRQVIPMTRYWFTTAWPHPLNPSQDFPWYVYVQQGRKADGLKLSPGDLVVFYETGSRRRHLQPGTQIPVELQEGRQGVVCVAEVSHPLRQRSSVGNVIEYQDGAAMNWAWEIPCAHHERGPTVHYADVLEVLGRRSVRIPGGLLELTKSQYDRFRSLMKLPSKE